MYQKSDNASCRDIVGITEAQVDRLNPKTQYNDDYSICFSSAQPVHGSRSGGDPRYCPGGDPGCLQLGDSECQRPPDGG